MYKFVVITRKGKTLNIDANSRQDAIKQAKVPISSCTQITYNSLPFSKLRQHG